MSTHRSRVCLLLAVVVLSLMIVSSYVYAANLIQPQVTVNSLHQDAFAKVMQRKAALVTPEMRQAAAKRAAQARTGNRSLNRLMAMPMAAPIQGGVPNYFGPEPNWAYSPQPTVNPITGAISGGIRKFVDSLPGLTVAGSSTLGNYIPIAVPDTTTYPGCDYYEIELGQYTQKLHSDLQPTTLRGYRQTNTSDATISKFQYLGPLIIAQKNRPVRIKFTNSLPTGAGGNLFLPVDTTEMGAGMGPLGMNTTPGYPMAYTENRGTLHLHGGNTPWISDGTPHQWITPAGELTDYPKGVSVRNVPDMPDPGDGSQTFFYSNQQSARLMFYHDHAYGITRLNVYGGEAAGYLLQDPTELDLVTRGIIPADQIPLIIQDKTFVDTTTVLATDPTWPFALDPTLSNFWYPHVYMPNQNPNDPQGANAVGRWDYGPWFWPPWPVVNQPIVDPITGFVTPNLPNLSMTMEAFHDTPVVNGTPYPYITVDPKAYRFRILNAGNDRGMNLQLYMATSIVGSIKLTGGGSGYIDPPLVNITNGVGDTTGHSATAEATVDPVTGAVTGLQMVSVGGGYTADPIVTIAPPPTLGGVTATATAKMYSAPTEVGMVPAVRGAAAFPAGWLAQTIGQTGDILDGRSGGIPDPAGIGPPMIQIGTEGGFLPAPVVFPDTPIGFNRNPKDITVTNVLEHNLLLGPAERADVIIDFSQYAGKTFILYNDNPAAHPAPDSRVDYYTSDVPQTDTGGTVSTLPGYGPNIRTVMQIRVNATAPAAPFNLTALNNEFASTPTTPGVFARSQDPIIVPQAPYNSAYNGSFPSGKSAYSRIQSTSLTFTPLGEAAPVTIPFQPKAIQELFENNFGRMVANLGVELPFTNGNNQTTIQYGYVDPATEIIDDTANPSITPIGTLGDGTQIWKITHNGVDTHPIHFHLFNVQLINRVGWDGMVKPPEPNELGWKDTLRMNPLEDCIVAFRATSPKSPFGVPDSVRPYDPTMPVGPGAPGEFRNLDPITGFPIVTNNDVVNFGWEYVWHCHILSHEEMDMMRPMIFNVARALATAPVLGATGNAGSPVNLSWTDATPPLPAYPTIGNNWGNPANEIGFRVERAVVTGSVPGAYSIIGSALANQTSYVDSTTLVGVVYDYRVVAYNAAGDSVSNVVMVGMAPPNPPANLVATAIGPFQVNLTWSLLNSTQTGIRIERAIGAGAFAPLTTVGPTAVAFSDFTVPDGTTLRYRLIAFNTGGNSLPSNIATATTPLAPPTSLAAALSAAPPLTVNLTWVDNSITNTGFTVQRTTDPNFLIGVTTCIVPSGTATSFLDTTGLLANRTYYYRVQSTLGVVVSTWATVSISTAIPAAPSGLTAIASPLSTNPPTVALAWTDNSTNEANFTIQRATNSFFTAGVTNITVPANTTTYTDAISIPNMRYWYKVQAVNGAGISGWSNTASAWPGQLPLAPTGLAMGPLTLVAGNWQGTATWTDNATNETSYTIQYGRVGGTTVRTTVLPANSTSFLVTGLGRHLQFFVQVFATNAAGNSAMSNQVIVNTN